MEWIGPQGTPASFKRSTHSALERDDRRDSISALSASRFFRRAAAVAYAGLSISASAPIARQRRSQSAPPTAAMLMWPSGVLNTPVGMLVGWLLPAWHGTSPRFSH